MRRFCLPNITAHTPPSPKDEIRPTRFSERASPVPAQSPRSAQRSGFRRESKSAVMRPLSERQHVTADTWGGGGGVGGRRNVCAAHDVNEAFGGGNVGVGSAGRVDNNKRSAAPAEFIRTPPSPCIVHISPAEMYGSRLLTRAISSLCSSAALGGVRNLWYINRSTQLACDALAYHEACSLCNGCKSCRAAGVLFSRSLLAAHSLSLSLSPSPSLSRSHSLPSLSGRQSVTHAPCKSRMRKSFARSGEPPRGPAARPLARWSERGQRSGEQQPYK